MKTSLGFLALFAVLALPSCEEYAAGGYDSGSYYGGGGSYSTAYRPTYYRPSYAGSYYSDDYAYASRPYYGNAYYGGSRYHSRSAAYCEPERGHSSNHSDNRIKLIRGNDGDHPNRPQGYHPESWYKNRGYDLTDYAHKHTDGKVHKGDDDDKHHHHKH